MEAYIIIIALAIIIIISHFLNIYSEKTGVPSVLILILFGAILQLDQSWFNFEILNQDTQKPLLKMLGISGLILILLEAALDLKINKTMIFASLKAFFAAILGLIGTAFAGAYILQYFFENLSFLSALFYSTPLAILSSAIIIPSTHTFPEDKKSFLIYESTFSDVLGLLMFQILIGVLEKGAVNSSQIIGKLGATIIFSVLISILLIYVFQKIKGHTKLFLLFSILILLYAVGEVLHLSSLLIVLIFGIILNNHDSIFKGFLKKMIEKDEVDKIQDGFKIIIQESAFVVRTFFFILFGYYVSLDSLLNIDVIIISLVMLFMIYCVRFLVLLPTLRTSTWPELFLSPRGLITILLFFSIPLTIVGDHPELSSLHTDIVPGIFLCVILGSALAMSNALIGFKKEQAQLLANETALGSSEELITDNDSEQITNESNEHTGIIEDGDSPLQEDGDSPLQEDGDSPLQEDGDSPLQEDGDSPLQEDED